MRLPCAILGLTLLLTAPASGRLIAYTSCEQDGGETRPSSMPGLTCTGSIWVAQEDGTGRLRLTQGHEDSAGGDGNPIWTPDSRSILFQRRMPGSQQVVRLWAVDPDGTNLRPLTHGAAPWTDSNPVFSRDGTRMAFTRVANGGIGWAVGTVRLDGTDPTVAAHGGRQGEVMAFSPDGSRVLFAETESGAESSFYSAELDGSDRQFAFQGTLPMTAISSNGRWFAWGLESSTTVAVADLRAGTADVVTPQGFLLHHFSPRDPNVLQVSAVDGSAADGWAWHPYEIDLGARGRPHRPTPEEVIWGAVPQPGPVPPEPGALAATIAFGFVDPYQPNPEQDFEDPWDEPSRASLRGAGTDTRPTKQLGYTALAYAGLRSVSYSVGRRTGRGRCSYFTGRRFLIHGRCGARHWRRTASAEAWESAAARLPHGTYEVAFRAVDRRGRRSHGRVRVVRL